MFKDIFMDIFCFKIFLENCKYCEKISVIQKSVLAIKNTLVDHWAFLFWHVGINDPITTAIEKKQNTHKRQQQE